MKTIYKFFAFAAIVAGFAACNKQTFVQPSMVVVGSSSFTATEDVGELKIPVRVVGGAATSVTFKVVNGSAVAGSEFSVNPASGVLEFAAGQQTDTIRVSIVDKTGTFTGDKSFGIEIVSATNGVAVGGVGQCVVNIKDNDHPLTDFFGEYTMKSVSVSTSGSYNYFTWTMNMSADEKDVTKVVCDYMCYFAYNYDVECSLTGVVSEDKKKITFTLPQVSESDSGDFFSGNLGMFGYWGWSAGNMNGEPITKIYDVVFNLQEDGSWVTTDSFHMNATEYVKTADWLYYMMNNCAGFNAAYPTYFIKN